MKEGNERKIRKMLETQEILIEEDQVKYKTEGGYKKATFGWEGLENVPPEITQIMDDEDIGLPDLEDEIRKIEKWTREPRETPKIKDLDLLLDVGSRFTVTGRVKYVRRKTFTRRDGSEGSLLSFYIYDGSPRGLRVIMWDADHPIEEGDHCTVKGKLQYNKYIGKLELNASEIEPNIEEGETDEIQTLIEEIRKKYAHEVDGDPDLQEALTDIEEEEVFSTDAVSLTVLGNYQAEDGELNRLIEELYDQTYRMAEKKEYVLGVKE